MGLMNLPIGLFHALIERLTVVSQSKLSINLGILFVVRLVGCFDENLKDITTISSLVESRIIQPLQMLKLVMGLDSSQCTTVIKSQIQSSEKADKPLS